MSENFFGKSDATMDAIVRSASVKGGLNFEEMKLALRGHLGMRSETDACYEPRDTSDPLYRREDAQQTAAQTAASVAQAVLSLTARHVGEGEFRRIYRQNDEFEIWGASKQELNAKEEKLRQLLS